MTLNVSISFRPEGDPRVAADWLVAFRDRLSVHGTCLPKLPAADMPA